MPDRELPDLNRGDQVIVTHPELAHLPQSARTGIALLVYTGDAVLVRFDDGSGDVPYSVDYVWPFPDTGSSDDA